MYANLLSASLFGLDGTLVAVETDLSSGMPAFTVVGLPDAAVKEARERIRAALMNSGQPFPMKRITVNLSPADTRKEGTHFDLPIALGILRAEGVLTEKFRQWQMCAFFGELSLEGKLVPIRGALPLAITLRERGIRKLVLPEGNLKEVQILEDMEFYPADSLNTLLKLLEQPDPALFCIQGGRSQCHKISETTQESLDFSQVCGQAQAKRAFQISASGGHSLLMIGPPGAGKTMMAQRLPGILPTPRYEEVLEITKIYSIAGELPENGGIMNVRPFRAPHHTISAAALAGGGNRPRPGEISLAHGGVLFLDEFPEFSRRVLETLRQPLEEKRIVISRAAGTAIFPADFLMIAACNPCPCGYYKDGTDRCQCSATEIRKYLAKLSGPLLDRIDLHLVLERVGWEMLNGTENASGGNGMTSAQLRETVCRARKIQAERYRNETFQCNAQLSAEGLARYCRMTPDAERLLKHAFEVLRLSARSYRKILVLARTVADLQEKDQIGEMQIAEAIQYRHPGPID